MQASRALDAYKQVDLESAILSASSVQLIVMLYDGALSAIRGAKSQIERQQFASKGRLISKAINIVSGLRAALDFEQGGEISQNLQDLYFYIERRLMDANLHNDTAPLDESTKLLAEVREAWVELSKTHQPAASVSKEGLGTVSYGKV